MAPRTRKQLAEKLAAKEVPAEIVVEVLDRFEEVGLVDDRAFAESFVHARRSGRGRRALAQELRRKGVDDETAADALEVVDHDSQAEAARELVRRKLRSTAGLERAVRERRLFGLLARRGFPTDVVLRVVREELDGQA
ncbi:regulatory protein [Kineococcus radiotolerans]|uniref:Regulatory protein RecX n=3 Tax=Kineococcus radiotolerans TaxID=131568 RepID=A6W842_KINRD|nr:regulatory protein RecX [Kineococcus radiotolerans]ABS02981.1 regulatory protein RecX [Kineococcus radiotolerans SRS30216 = ATCC BAA-149]MBB2899816.1 regulatory protein [Kineococcus radiotolerans]